MHKHHISVSQQINSDNDIAELIGVGMQYLAWHVLLDQPHTLLLGVGHDVISAQPLNEKPKVLRERRKLLLDPLFMLVVVVAELLTPSRDNLFPIILLEVLDKSLFFLFR